MKSYIQQMLEQNQIIANTISEQSGSSFYYSFFFLSKEKRHAIQTVYSFCRISDDIVDETGTVEEKRTALNLWREMFIQSEFKAVEHPIITQVNKVIKHFNIPRVYFLDIIKGMSFDLDKNVYHTFDELLEYTYLVASVVGLITIEIFSYTEKSTKDYAIHLGTALQLTNITRDAFEDAENNRFYIPSVDFDRFNYSHEELSTKTNNSAFKELMRFQAERAENYYQKAADALSEKDKKTMIVPEIMNAIYYENLKLIRAVDFDIFTKRPSLSKGKKLSLALMSYLKQILNG